MNSREAIETPMSADPYAPCPHPSRTCVRKDASDASVRHYLQCDACGSLGGAIRQTDPRISQAIPYREIAETQWRDRAAEIGRDREAKAAEWRGRYEAHLQSDEWANRRQKVIAREANICQGCRAAPGAHVHHLTYGRLGRELLIDLVLLCVACHEVAHNKEIGR